VIDVTSFETEEILLLKSEKKYTEVGALFFDPNGGTLYAECDGTIYEWDLQKNKHGPAWWIGEE
jgi:WD40 repeat protein